MQMSLLAETEEISIKHGEVVPGDTAKVHLSPKLQEYRRNVWNKACQVILLSNPDHALKFLIASILAGESRNIEAYKFEPFFRKVADTALQSTTPHQHNRLSLADCLTSADMLNNGQLHKLLTAVSVVLVPKMDEAKVTTLLKWLDADLGSYWKVEEQFLLMLTKGEIEAVCGELGVTGYMGAAFARSASGKKTDLISAILKSGFPFEGKTPAIMRF